MTAEMISELISDAFSNIFALMVVGWCLFFLLPKLFKPTAAEMARNEALARIAAALEKMKGGDQDA